MAREAAEGKNVMGIGAEVALQCIQEQLIDKIQVYAAPVLLGDGVRFFSWSGARGEVR